MATLNGYSRRSGKRSGGIRSVALTGADAIAGFTFDGYGVSVTGLALAPGQGFALYNFKEDEAEYSEQLSTQNGITAVDHRLSFFIERMDVATIRAVEELASATRGVVALITMATGETFVAGISGKFGTERPLRLNSAQASSGRRMADETGETITLESRDDSKAAIFAGDLAQLIG